MMKLANRAMGLLLGIVLVLQGISNAFAISGPNSSRSMACCRSDCNSRHCATSACCAKPANEGGEIPSTPARSSSQDEWQDIAPLFQVILTATSPRPEQIPSSFSSNDTQIAVPIFQRNCSYLI